MKKKELIALGFKLDREYHHDGFHTSNYSRGIIKIEVTKKDGKILISELSVNIEYQKAEAEKIAQLLAIFPNL